MIRTYVDGRHVSFRCLSEASLELFRGQTVNGQRRVRGGGLGAATKITKTRR